MKLQSMKCPSCNAPFSADIERDTTLFCPYCGTKIMVNADKKCYEINVNQTTHHIDDAQIKRVDAEKEIALKELELNKKRSTQRNALILISIALVAVFSLFLIFKIFPSKSNKADSQQQVIVQSQTDGFLDLSTGLTFYDSEMELLDAIEINGSRSQEIYNDKSIQIKVDSFTSRNNSEYAINFSISNNRSDQKVSCYIANSSLDDYQINTYHTWGYDFVIPQKKGLASCTLSKKDIDALGKSDFHYYSGYIYVITSDGQTGNYIAEIPFSVAYSLLVNG